MSNYDQTISLPLDNPVRVADIRSFNLTKTARLVGKVADLWDLDAVTLDAYGGFPGHSQLFHLDGHPLMRFSENSTTFSGDIQR